MKFTNLRKWRYFKKLDYTPRRGQLAGHNAADRHTFVSLFSYPRGGKSVFAAREVGATWFMTGTKRHPGHHCWIVAPTYDLGSKEFGYIWEDHGRLGLLKRATKAHFDIRGGDMEIVYPWGWFVRVRTVENPLTLLADELNELILSEASQLPETVWDRYLSARTKVRHGRVFVPTTPKGRNWLYDRFYLPSRQTLDGQRNKLHDDAYWSAIVSHLPNVGDIYQPGVYPEDAIARARREMPPDVFAEQFGGDFVSYAGRVWSHLSKPRHLAVGVTQPPEDSEIVVSIDPGAGDPTAVLFGAWDRQRPRHLWLWHAHKEMNQPITYFGELVVRVLAGRRPWQIIADPAEKQTRLELMKAGLSNTTPYTRIFEDGYNAVTTLIDTGRFHVCDTPAMDSFWKETDRYMWREDAKGVKQAGKTIGQDHYSDTLRYMALMPPTDVAEPPKPDPLSTMSYTLTESEKAMWRDWEAFRERAANSWEAAKSGLDDPDIEEFEDALAGRAEDAW